MEWLTGTDAYIWITETFAGRTLATFFVSMIPVVELRGAIPLGVGLGLPPWYSMLVAIAGNMVPVPFVVLFIRRVFEWMKTKSERLARWVDKRVEKTMKRRRVVYHSELLGLVLFVAVPLPGTGAWTGGLLAALLNVRLRNAVLCIFAGVVIAAVIITSLTYGFLGIFG